MADGRIRSILGVFAQKNSQQFSSNFQRHRRHFALKMGSRIRLLFASSKVGFAWKLLYSYRGLFQIHIYQQSEKSKYSNFNFPKRLSKSNNPIFSRLIDLQYLFAALNQFFLSIHWDINLLDQLAEYKGYCLISFGKKLYLKDSCERIYLLYKPMLYA